MCWPYSLFFFQNYANPILWIELNPWPQQVNNLRFDPQTCRKHNEAWNSMWRCVPQGKVHQRGDEDGSRVHLDVPHRSRSLVRPVVWKGEKPTGWQIGGGLNWEEGLKMGRRMSEKRSVSLEACCSLYWRGVLLPGQPAGPWLVFGAALQWNRCRGFDVRLTSGLHKYLASLFPFSWYTACVFITAYTIPLPSNTPRTAANQLSLPGFCSAWAAGCCLACIRCSGVFSSASSPSVL